jgi:hypothetical protein
MTFADWLQTFILGFAAGFFGLCGAILYFIHLDDQEEALKRAAKEYASKFNLEFNTAMQIIKNRQPK